MRQLDSITDSMETNLSAMQGIVEDRGTCQAAAYEVTKSQTRLLLLLLSGFSRVRLFATP